MLVNFLGVNVNLTKFAPPNIELALGVIFFFLFFVGVIAMVMKFPKKKKKVMNHSHLITREKQDFPTFFLVKKY
jgi:cbb3-type cytochrome oxidase subunit 3